MSLLRRSGRFDLPKQVRAQARKVEEWAMLAEWATKDKGGLPVEGQQEERVFARECTSSVGD
jgi:hypothetical protein